MRVLSLFFMDFNNFFWAINTKNIKKLGLLKYIQIESEL